MPCPRLAVTLLEGRWTPAAGDLDPTFGTNGTATPSPDSATQYAVAGQPDGAVLVTVFQGTATFSVLAVRRLLADGRPDARFGDNGLASVPVAVANASSAAVAATAAVVAPDGRIVLAGRGDGPELLVARLTADGRPDPTFGSNGLARVALTDGTAPAFLSNDSTGLAVMPDGRVVAGGSVVTSTDITAGRGRQSGFVVRLSADGRPDPSFGTNGVAVVRPDGLDARVANLAALPDGRVLLVGAFGDAAAGGLNGAGTFTAVRLTAGGQPDQTFGAGGKLSPPDAATFTAVAVRPDGTALLAGGRETGRNRFTAFYQPVVVRLRPDGSRDPGFAGGVVVPASTGRLGTPTAVGFTQDGGALLVTPGVTDFANSTSPEPSQLVRLRADGTPNPTYGANGVASADSLGAVVLQPNGQVLTATNGAVTRRTGDPRPGNSSLLVGGSPDGTARLLAPGGDAAGAAVQAFPNFAGTARTALADVTGDGVPDLVVGAGPGGGPNVQVFSGATGQRVANLDVFEASFTGGVFVAAGDLDGDGKAEVVVTPDQGGGPVAAVFRADGTQVSRFFGIEDPAFRGGARPAVGDVNGDGRPDLLVAAGFGGGPRLAVFDGRGVAGGAPPKLLPDFFVFEQSLRNGVFVASGDLTGDGAAEVVVGGGPGGGPRVFALDGRALVAGAQTPVVNFFAGDSTTRGGVRVAVRTGADGSPQLVTGSGEGEPARVRVYTPATARRGGAADQELEPFGGAALADGVYVG